MFSFEYADASFGFLNAVSSTVISIESLRLSASTHWEPIIWEICSIVSLTDTLCALTDSITCKPTSVLSERWSSWVMQGSIAKVTSSKVARMLSPTAISFTDVDGGTGSCGRGTLGL